MVAPLTLTLHASPTLAPKLTTVRPFSSPRPSLILPCSNALQCKKLLPPSFAPIRAVSVDSEQLGSAEQSQKVTPKRYYFLVANAKFMLDEEEHFKEQLDERLRNFGERNKAQDFWLVIEPKFLDKFPNVTKRLKRPAVALVSTDGTWITFMKLRLDRVLTESFEADTLEEALASNPVELHFDKPEKWTAPYPKYEYGWWEVFLPPGSSKSSS